MNINSSWSLYTTTANHIKQNTYIYQRESETYIREREREFLTYHTQTCPCFIIGFLLVFAFKGAGGAATEGPGFATIPNQTFAIVNNTTYKMEW